MKGEVLKKANMFKERTELPISDPPSPASKNQEASIPPHAPRPRVQLRVVQATPFNRLTLYLQARLCPRGRTLSYFVPGTFIGLTAVHTIFGKRVMVCFRQKLQVLGAYSYNVL